MFRRRGDVGAFDEPLIDYYFGGVHRCEGDYEGGRVGYYVVEEPYNHNMTEDTMYWGNMFMTFTTEDCCDDQSDDQSDDSR